MPAEQLTHNILFVAIVAIGIVNTFTLWRINKINILLKWISTAYTEEEKK